MVIVLWGESMTLTDHCIYEMIVTLQVVELIVNL